MDKPFVEATAQAALAPAGPALSVVVLTYNEQENIAACLRSLAAQTRNDFEVIVLDAHSTDRTAEIVRELQATLPLPLRLEVAATRISVGAARNRGVELALAPIVAFLSADTEAEPQWVEHALARSRDHQLVFGRQVHSPRRHGVGAAVRGLRYHFPDAPTDDPKRYASNVNAAIRKDVLRAYPFGITPGASAIDDILLARRAAAAGYRLAYEPNMVVHHHDVDTWRAEMAKNRREGLGLGEFASEVGYQWAVLAWAALLLGALLFVGLGPGPLSLGLLLLTLWLPALRRALRHQGKMRPADVLLGVLASPVFDLMFLLAYVRGLLAAKPPEPEPAHGREVET